MAVKSDRVVKVRARGFSSYRWQFFDAEYGDEIKDIDRAVLIVDAADVVRAKLRHIDTSEAPLRRWSERAVLEFVE